MEDKTIQEKLKNTGGTGSDLRVVRINYNSAPDAEERLRRLFTLLLKYAARDGLPSRETDSSQGGCAQPQDR